MNIYTYVPYCGCQMFLQINSDWNHQVCGHWPLVFMVSWFGWCIDVSMCMISFSYSFCFAKATMSVAYVMLKWFWLTAWIRYIGYQASQNSKDNYQIYIYIDIYIYIYIFIYCCKDTWKYRCCIFRLSSNFWS